jgi:hypothetical protein
MLCFTERANLHKLILLIVWYSHHTLVQIADRRKRKPGNTGDQLTICKTRTWNIGCDLERVAPIRISLGSYGDGIGVGCRRSGC